MVGAYQSSNNEKKLLVCDSDREKLANHCRTMALQTQSHDWTVVSLPVIDGYVQVSHRYDPFVKGVVVAKNRLKKFLDKLDPKKIVGTLATVTNCVCQLSCNRATTSGELIAARLKLYGQTKSEMEVTQVLAAILSGQNPNATPHAGMLFEMRHWLVYVRVCMLICVL